jgi:hypothetical protein
MPLSLTAQQQLDELVSFLHSADIQITADNDDPMASIMINRIIVLKLDFHKAFHTVH